MRVLHVDDDPDVRMIVQMIIDGQPEMDLVSVATADEARQAVEQTRFDVLLIDVMMPGTDGPALLGELRQRPELAAVPAIFVTAKAHPSDLDALSSTSAVDIVVKPFDAVDLATRVRACLAARPV